MERWSDLWTTYVFGIDPPIRKFRLASGCAPDRQIISDNEYLVTALRARVSFSLPDELAGQVQKQWLSGFDTPFFENGAWVWKSSGETERARNDWGLKLHLRARQSIKG